MNANTENVHFCDLPHDVRMDFRRAIDSAGGHVEGYHENLSVQVLMPNPCGPFLDAMKAAGLEIIQGSMFFFPLGSDRYPDSLRHDGSYPGSKGFTLSARFVVA